MGVIIDLRTLSVASTTFISTLAPVIERHAEEVIDGVRMSRAPACVCIRGVRSSSSA